MNLNWTNFLLAVVAYLISVKIIGVYFGQAKVKTFNDGRMTLKALFFFPASVCYELQHRLEWPKKTHFDRDHLILDNGDTGGLEKFYAFIWPWSLAWQLLFLTIMGGLTLWMYFFWGIGLLAQKLYYFFRLDRVYNFLLKPLCN